MKESRTSFPFTTKKLRAKDRALLFATVVAVGVLFVLGTTFWPAAPSTTRALAASQPETQGGATAEMLAVALDLKSATDFAVFGGHGVHGNNETVIRGHVGSNGEISGLNVPESSPENRGQAMQDLKDAMRIIAQLPCAAVAGNEISGKTFGPGVYCLSSANLAGQMMLDAGGDPNARFVFRINGGLNVGHDSRIELTNGASATNAYFVATGDVTVGADSMFKANVISDNNITIGARSTVSSKTVGVNGDVNIESANIGGGTGVVEICKALAPGDPIAVGTLFSFTIGATTVQVPAGACSAPMELAAGNVTVTEAVRANTAVTSIVTSPTDRRVSFNLGTRSAVITVVEGDVNNQTVVTFTNQTTRTGTLEICKNALGADVTGIFQFTVQGVPGQTFSVPVGFCSGPITTTILQTPNTTFTANVTELAQPNFRLENVTTFPANRLTGPFVPNQGFDANGNPITNTNGGYANVTLIAGGGVNQQTTVNFFNRALPGQIKVCKITADPTNIPVGTLFRFTVSGLAPTSSTQTLPGVGVTTTVDVPAGPASQNGFCQFVTGTFVVGEPVLVTETGLAPGQTLPGGLTFADTRVSRIRSSTGFSATPVTVATATGPTTVNAPNPNLANRTAVIAARNTTAEVEFTNFIFRPAILKICKIAGTGVATGTNFTFNLSLVDPLTSLPVSTAPITVPAGSCTFANGPFPANENFPGIGTFNFGTQIIVTEAAATGVTLTTVTSPSGGPITVSLPSRTGTLTLNQALASNLFNEIAFTNAATVAPPPTTASVRFDFDGDHRADPAVFRPSNGTWWYLASGSGGDARAAQFGANGDRVVPADYDGDGKTDFAVYRNGDWYILNSSGGVRSATFGTATDIPQTGDFDGDGKADLVVYRPSNGGWYMLLSRDGVRSFGFGNSTDIPVAADYDGDGKMDAAVYRGGVWYIMGSTSGFTAFQFGVAGDVPVPADYDGDHRADAAVYRAGTWHLLRSSAGYVAMQFGMSSDTPVPADYDGDGKTDVAVYRSSNGGWHIMRSSLSEAGDAYVSFGFGAAGDMIMNY